MHCVLLLCFTPLFKSKFKKIKEKQNKSIFANWIGFLTTKSCKPVVEEEVVAE